jgi:hypothetical protein
MAAVFVDDQQRYCAGAAVLGVTAVQMVRGDSDGKVRGTVRWFGPCGMSGRCSYARGGLTARVAMYPGMYRAVASA